MAILPIGKSVDGVAFDPITNNIISTNGGDGTITVIHRDLSTNYTVVATLPTAKGARTLAIDPNKHYLFTCTADLGPAQATTTENSKPRPAIIPNTFRVLEFGK